MGLYGPSTSTASCRLPSPGASNCDRQRRRRLTPCAAEEEQVHAPSQGSPQPDTSEHRLLISPLESGSCLQTHRPAEPSCPLALFPNLSHTSLPHEEHTLTPVSHPADHLPVSPKPQGYLLVYTEFSPFNFFNFLFTTSFQLFKKLITYSVALGSFSTCILISIQKILLHQQALASCSSVPGTPCMGFTAARGQVVGGAGSTGVCLFSWLFLLTQHAALVHGKNLPPVVLISAQMICCPAALAKLQRT